MPTDQSSNYLQTKVLTASPEELRLMLLDGAIKFCTQGRDALRDKNFEGCHAGYSRCRAILVELISSMRTEIDPDLCEKVSSLYLFMINQLIESSHSKNADLADKVIELLEYDRETWLQLMQRLADERRHADVARARVHDQDLAGAPDRPSLSISA